MIDWFKKAIAADDLYRARVRRLFVILGSLLLLGWQPAPYIVSLVNQTSEPVVVRVHLSRYPTAEPAVIAANETKVIYRGNYTGGSCSHEPEIPEDMRLEVRKGKKVVFLDSARFRQVATWDDARRWWLRVDEEGVGHGAARVPFGQ
jgi:hypothetical protein